MYNNESLARAKQARNFSEFIHIVAEMRPVNDILLRAGMSINDAAKGLGITEWKDLAKLKVVDLGCGSRLVPRVGHNEGWVPYYCLMMANLGASVIGVDIVPADKEDGRCYTHITNNLVKRVKDGGNFSEIGMTPGTANIVNTNMLAQLQPVSANLRKTLEDEKVSLDWFRDELARSVMTMLVDGGVWVNDLETKVK